MEVYDPATNTWEAGPDLPVPLCAMGVVKYYGTIYILGVYSFSMMIQCTRSVLDFRLYALKGLTKFPGNIVVYF